MSQADLDLVITDPTANRSERMLSHSLAVMIEVPAIKPGPIEHGPRMNSRAHEAVGRRPSPFQTTSSPRGLPGWLCADGSGADRLGVHTRLVKSAGPDRRLFDLGPAPRRGTMDRDGFVEKRPPARNEGRAGQAAIASRGAVMLSSRARGRGSRKRRGDSRDFPRLCAAG